MLQLMRSGALSGFFMVLLVLGAAGLILTDNSGMLTSGITATDVAKAGEKSIPYVPFDRKVRNILRGQNIAPEDAYKLGYVDNILQGQTRELVLTQAANDYGIITSDKQVLKTIDSLLEKSVPAGSSKKEYLDRILYSQGMSQGELINSTKRELTINLLQKSLLANVNFSPRFIVEDLYQHNKETRNIDTLIIKDENVTLEKEATDEALKSYYNSHKNEYAVQEQRQFTMGYFLPEDLTKDESVSEEDIKQAYEDNIASYALPEQRLLEQALLETEEEAKKVASAAEQGKSIKTAVVNATGKHDGYLGEDKFEKESLIDDLSEPVFTSQKGTVIGPHQSAIGWHVIKINDIIEAHTSPLSEVRDSIKEDLIHETFAEQLIDVANEIDDRISSGETLNEIKQSGNIPLTLMTSELTTRFGVTIDGAPAFQIEELEADKPFILETAFELEAGESSSTVELASGGFLIITNDNIIDKHYPSFSDIKDNVLDKWTRDEKHIQNIVKSQQLALKLKSGETTLKEIAKELNGTVKTLKDIKRSDDLSDQDLSGPALTQIFNTKVHESAISVMNNAIAITVVKSATLPEIKGIKESELETIYPTVHRDLQNELNEALYTDFLKKYPVIINRNLLDQLYKVSRDDQ